MIRFKLDENLHEEGAAFLRARGHDVVTVEDEGLRGANDRTLSEVCRREGRVLLTQDKDFADVRTFPPGASPGTVVLRLPRQGPRCALEALARALPQIEEASLCGALWIVEPGRIRARRAAPKGHASR